MSKLVSLCLGIMLLAALSGCNGTASNNANNAAGPANSNSVNPANPNSPNTPPNVNAPGGPIAQENGKNGKPSLSTNTISPAPSEGSATNMASMDFHGALLRGNKEQMSVLMADDYKGTMADGSVLNKTQTLANAKDTQQMFSANVKIPDVKGDTATLKGDITLMGTDPQTSKPGQILQFTDIWRKHNGKWLISSTTITTGK